MAAQQGTKLAGDNPVSLADIANLHHPGVEPHELEQIEVGRIAMQVLQQLDVSREASAISHGPRVVGELKITPRCLQLRGGEGAVLPDTADGVGGLEHNRVMGRELFGHGEAADPCSNDPDSGCLERLQPGLLGRSHFLGAMERDEERN